MPHKRSHCKHGHALRGKNVVRRTLSDGRVKRDCRTCEYAKRARLVPTHRPVNRAAFVAALGAYGRLAYGQR